MSDFDLNLNTLFSDIVKRYNKIQLSNHSKDTLLESNKLLKEGVYLLNQLKSYTKSLETLLSDCQDFINDITDDLSEKPREEDFVYHTKNGMLSYPGRDLIIKPIVDELLKSKPVVKPIEKPTEKQIEKPHMEHVLIKEINYKMRIPVIQDMKQVQPMLYYYKGNEYEHGVYCSILPTIYTRIPFPEIIDSTKDFNRDRSIRCKYKTRSLCDDQRNKMAKYHKSTTRSCNFAHDGETLVKIGYPSRCASISNFGNPRTLSQDIKIIEIDDIKNILMYGLNDIITAAIWFDYTKYNIPAVFDKLDRA